MASVEAAQVLTRSGWVGPARVQLDDGVITDIEVLASTSSQRVMVPGFVDLQVNGIDDINVSTADGADWDRLDQLLLAQGVTTWCPTLVTMPLDRFERPLARIAVAMARPPAGRPTIAGAHLEGPFLGGAAGAHPKGQIVPIDLAWLQALPPHIAVVTLGAEQPLAAAATRLLVERGCLVSIGHTLATEQQFDDTVAAGARLTTHLFNAMSGVHHRSPGVAVWAMTHSDVCASLIADGIHVHPRVVRLAFNALGTDRTVLVTDAVAWRTGRVGEIGMKFRDGAPRLPDGTLAGSVLTMDAAIRVCVDAGVDLAAAVTAASSNPARLLGMRDRGVIEVGRRADLVSLTPALEIEQVWSAGEPV